MLCQIFRLHGLPRDIISDWGPQFTSHFGEFCSLLGAMVSLSSGFHPQSNTDESGIGDSPAMHGLPQPSCPSVQAFIRRCLRTWWLARFTLLRTHYWRASGVQEAGYKVTNPAAVHPRLPGVMHIHPSFHISWLKPVKESLLHVALNFTTLCHDCGLLPILCFVTDNVMVLAVTFFHHPFMSRWLKSPYPHPLLFS